MTVDVLPGYTYLFLLLFARLGAMVMLLPGLGERGIPGRIRLVMALLLAILFVPLLADAAPPVPPEFGVMLTMLIREIVLGIAIGLTVRLMMGAIQVAATTIAFQMGLGFAQNVDPTQGIQGAIFSSFMSVLAITLIMTTDTHHLLIAALYDSYAIIPAGTFPEIGDFTGLALQTVADSFRIAMQIAAPFMVFGTIFYLGMGIISRLIPQLQIFFVAMPVNIMMGFLLFLALLSIMMAWFIEYFTTGLAPLLVSA